MKQSIVRIGSDRKLIQGAYDGNGIWIPAGTHVELHGRGKDETGSYVFGTAAGRCVRFFDQQRNSDNAYRMAGEKPPTGAEFEARIIRLQAQFS